MKIGLYIIFIFILGTISYQDFTDRLVSLWVLLSGIFVGGLLHYLHQDLWVVVSNIGINIIFITFVFLILVAYAKFKMNKNIFEVFGQGDLLFFMLLAVSLPSLSFLVLFVFSLIFSLIVFLMIKKRLKKKTVPLAGLQSVFFICCLVLNELLSSIQLYTL